MTDEAVEYLSRRTIGADVKWDSQDSNNPHKWKNETGHPQYNKDADRITQEFVDKNKISKDNPMNVKQASEVETSLRRHEYNKSVQDYASQQRMNGNWRRGTSSGRGATQPSD